MLAHTTREARTMTIASRLRSDVLTLAQLGPDGVSGDSMAATLEPPRERVYDAIRLCLDEDLLSEVAPDRYESAAGTGGVVPSRVLRRVRKRINAAATTTSDPKIAIELARMLVNTEEAATSGTIHLLLGVVDKFGKVDPPGVRTLLDVALTTTEGQAHPRLRYQMALARIATLSLNDSESVWQAAFDVLYRSAIADGSLTEALDVLRYRVTQLAETGDYRNAKAEIRHALTIFGDVEPANAWIHMLAAQRQAYRGDLVEARESLRRLSTTADARHTEYKIELDESRSNVSAMLLEPEAMPHLRRQLRSAIDRDDAMRASIAAALGAGLSMTFGDPEEARVLAREAALRGTQMVSDWRGVDRATIEASYAFSIGDRPRFDEWTTRGIELANETGNRHGLRRLEALRLRDGLLRRDRDAVAIAVRAYQEAGDRLEPIFKSGDSGFAGAAAMGFCGQLRMAIDPERSATYFGLGGLLAAVETASSGGSRALAISLWRWTESDRAADLVTALDWPALVVRVSALLGLRLGKRKHVEQRLLGAITVAERLGYRVESAIARLQLAEIAEASGYRIRGQSVGDLRQQASGELLDLGYVPEPIALAAAQAWIRGTSAGRSTDLSRRESEVLGLLGTGLTYRQAGERLGTSWRTVQTQAKNAYAKLGARDRREAIAKARRRGEI